MRLAKMGAANDASQARTLQAHRGSARPLVPRYATGKPGASAIAVKRTKSGRTYRPSPSEGSGPGHHDGYPTTSGVTEC